MESSAYRVYGKYKFSSTCGSENRKPMVARVIFMEIMRPLP